MKLFFAFIFLFIATGISGILITQEIHSPDFLLLASIGLVYTCHLVTNALMEKKENNW